MSEFAGTVVNTGVDQGKKQITTTDPRILKSLRDAWEEIERPAEKHIGELAYKVGNQDAVKFIAKVPNDSVDLIFTDEPFGVAKTLIEFPDRGAMDTNFKWDLEVPSSMLIPWVLEAHRVLKPGGALVNCGFSEWSTLYKDICLDAGFLWKATVRILISNPRPQVRKRNFRSSHYDLWWVSKGVPKTFNFMEQQAMRNWIGEVKCPSCMSLVPMVTSNQYDWPEWIFSTKEVNGIWSEIGPLTNDPGRAHPTQKPEWLAAKYILVLSNENDIVLDPFCGSGTFPYVAACLGRHPIANDMTRKWKKFTESRLETIQHTMM